jgi:hypothetical protein
VPQTIRRRRRRDLLVQWLGLFLIMIAGILGFGAIIGLALAAWLGV